MTTPTTEAGRKMSRYLDHIDPAEWEYEADIRAIEQQAADAATARLREAQSALVLLYDAATFRGAITLSDAMEAVAAAAQAARESLFGGDR